MKSSRGNTSPLPQGYCIPLCTADCGRGLWGLTKCSGYDFCTDITKVARIMLLSCWNFCFPSLFIFLCLFKCCAWLTSQCFLWLLLFGIKDSMTLCKKSDLAEYRLHESRALGNHIWSLGSSGVLESDKPWRWWLWLAKDLYCEVLFCMEMVISPWTATVIACNKLTMNFSPVTVSEHPWCNFSWPEGQHLLQ